MELTEAREYAENVRLHLLQHNSATDYPSCNKDEALICLAAKITELEKQIKNDTGYREMKTLYNQIVKENKDNYEKRKELEAQLEKFDARDYLG